MCSNFTQNNRPILGILTLPTHGELARVATHYFPASYVKFLESGGARVVPILHTDPIEKIDQLFPKLNGILFTGGGANLLHSAYSRTAKRLIQHVMEAHDRGEHVPLWGTCLGFQAISTLIVGESVLTWCNVENVSLPLEYTPQARSSRLFGSLTQESFDILGSQAVTMNNHHWCLTVKTFQEHPKLRSIFNLLSTNRDHHGAEFVSSMEGKEYPIYAVQWHPEKNIFEWKSDESIAHSMDAVRPVQETSLFFVNEARKNSHRFPTVEEERAALIYNYDPIYTARHSEDSFNQCYVFP